MVMAWAFRLGSYLFIRILKDGKDKRFDNVRDNPSRFFLFWTIQGETNYLFYLLIGQTSLFFGSERCLGICHTFADFDVEP